jgi:membrane associated rhomboid family serine protease
VKGIYLIAFALLMWLLQAVSLSNTSAAAHLGGIATGFLVYALTARRNRIRLAVDSLLVKLHLKKQPRLTVVPRNDKWVN